MILINLCEKKAYGPCDSALLQNAGVAILPPIFRSADRPLLRAGRKSATEDWIDALLIDRRRGIVRRIGPADGSRCPADTGELTDVARPPERFATARGSGRDC